MLSLCFVQRVCFLLHCGVDDKNCECILHHEPVLCDLQFKDTLDIEHDYKCQNIPTGWYPVKELGDFFSSSFRHRCELLRDENNRQNYYILKDFLDFYFWFHRTFILLIRKCFMNIISLRLFIFLIHNRGTLIFFQIRASQAKSLTALSEQHCPASPLEQFSSEVVSAINTLLFPTLPDKKFPRLSL